jgi:microcompartment protein CcmL/EutN
MKIPHVYPAYPALAAIEVESIARGLIVVDGLVKRAEVRLLMADPVTPGKMVIVFSGQVAEVEESLDAAREAVGDAELDVLFLPHIHEAIVPAFVSGVDAPPITASLGILEFATISSTLIGADKALKAAEVELVALHLAKGIGGKGYFVFTGEQDSVEASLEAAEQAVADDLLVGRELIPRPHPDMDWVLGRL